jgi:hypothetical protein
LLSLGLPIADTGIVKDETREVRGYGMRGLPKYIVEILKAQRHSLFSGLASAISLIAVRLAI